MTNLRLSLALAAAFVAGSGATVALNTLTRVEVTCPAAVEEPSRDWLAPPPPPLTGGRRY